jgi:hypothetical protein
MLFILLLTLSGTDGGEGFLVMRHWKCKWATPTTQVCHANDNSTRTYFYDPKTCRYGKPVHPTDMKKACGPTRSEPPGFEDHNPNEGGVKTLPPVHIPPEGQIKGR